MKERLNAKIHRQERQGLLSQTGL